MPFQRHNCQKKKIWTPWVEIQGFQVARVAIAYCLPEYVCLGKG